MNKGLSLIEALISIFIFILVLVAIVGLILGLYKSYYFTLQQTQAIEEARNGAERMVKEIREARPGDDGSYIIERADDYEFIFYSDIDKDDNVEKVRYFIDGTDFKKGVVNPTGDPPEYTEPERISILSKYVRNQPPIFHYFDGNMNELPAPSRLKDTKLMKLYLAINVNPNKISQEFILQTEVQLRNLKENL